MCSLYESDSDEEDEFFDALDAGEIEAEDLTKAEEKEEKEQTSGANGELRAVKYREVQPSFKGYEEPIRERLKLDYDNRPRISLWVSYPPGQNISRKSDVRFSGNLEIHDWQGHDKDDAPCVFQRANFLASACGRGFGIRGPP